LAIGYLIDLCGMNPAGGLILFVGAPLAGALGEGAGASPAPTYPSNNA